MHLYKKHILQQLIAIILLCVFLCPSIIYITHIFETHEHVVCNDTSTHIHQDVHDCNICDFHLTSFNFEICKSPDFIKPNIPTKQVKQYTVLLFNTFKKTNAQLRAPPSLLFS